MQFVDEFRDPELAKKLVQRITERVRTLPSHCKLPLQLMEVCGGHTHAIFKFGLDQLLPPEIEFVHGPGCPVCVLPMGRIDECVEIASQPDVIFLYLWRCHARPWAPRFSAGCQTQRR